MKAHPFLKDHRSLFTGALPHGTPEEYIQKACEILRPDGRPSIARRHKFSANMMFFRLNFCNVLDGTLSIHTQTLSVAGTD
jgi:hypothetical protein